MELQVNSIFDANCDRIGLLKLRSTYRILFIPKFLVSNLNRHRSNYVPETEKKNTYLV